METAVYQHYISDYSSDALAPLMVGAPGSYPAGQSFDSILCQMNVMSCHTPRAVLTLLASDILSHFTATVLYKCLPFQQPDSSVGIPVGARVFFFCKTFGPAVGPTQLPTQWILGKSIRVRRFTARLHLVPRL